MSPSSFAQISPREDELGRHIVDAAFSVHTHLGAGLLESVYEACFCHELAKRQLHFQRQVIVPVRYDDIVLDQGFRLDVLVEDLVICELKAICDLPAVCSVQLLTYLRLANKRLGFLINFNVPLIKDGIQRMVI